MILQYYIYPISQLGSSLLARIKVRYVCDFRSCLTPEQYLAIERSAESRAALMRARGRSPPDIAYISPSKYSLLNDRQGPFFYPDVSVYRGDPQLADDFKDTLLNPTLVIEVLSPSSEAYDRGKKFAAYRRIDFASRICPGFANRTRHRELPRGTGRNVDRH